MSKIILAGWSGGRDSTATILKWLEEGNRLDYIVFTDTLQEFPLMYEYIAKVIEYIKENYGTSIIVTKPATSFESWVFGKVTRGERKGKIRGLPMKITPCFWKRESKVKPMAKLLEVLGVKDTEDYQLLIGYTASEKGRVQNDKNLLYPLIDWNWCEGDVDEYLKSIDMINPLYEQFIRTGCAFCPYMELKSYYLVWKFYNKTWRYMKKLERSLRSMDNVVNSTWHDKYTLLDLEQQFISGSRVYDDTPVASCECKLPAIEDPNSEKWRGL